LRKAAKRDVILAGVRTVCHIVRKQSTQIF